MTALAFLARFRPGRVLVALMLGVFAMGGNATCARAEEALDSVLTSFSAGSQRADFTAQLAFSREPRIRMIVLTDPNRIVLDLYGTVSAVKDFGIQPNRLVTSLRQGLVSKDRFRLIFELARPAVPDLVTGSSDGKPTATLRIAEADPKTFVSAAQRLQETPQLATGAIAPAVPEKTFTVVIDPGHGGIDTGAIGKHGTLEKDVNLKFGVALRDVLATDPRIRVIMTRNDDTFIPLLERSEIARRSKADLFVSMHSDSIRYAELRGASVYTLSEKASDSLARDLADSENSADRFVDPKWRDGRPEVFDILIELMRRETENMSEHFAAGLVSELGRHDIRLIRNPKRSAGFKVLTAPDVPSVLLEIGYLSNVDDEQLLLDPSWRDDSANAIAAAIRRFLGVGMDGRAADAD